MRARIVKCNAPSHSRIKLDNKLMCCPEMRALTKVYDKAHARGKVSLCGTRWVHGMNSIDDYCLNGLL